MMRNDEYIANRLDMLDRRGWEKSDQVETNPKIFFVFNVALFKMLFK